MTYHASEIPYDLDGVILRILDYYKGSDSAISRSQLISALKLHGFDMSRDDRPMRLAINHLRKQGEPICSSGGEGGGYYLATNRTELDEYIEREVQSKIRDYSEQIKAMRAHYPQDNQLRMI